MITFGIAPDVLPKRQWATPCWARLRLTGTSVAAGARFGGAAGCRGLSSSSSYSSTGSRRRPAGAAWRRAEGHGQQHPVQRESGAKRHGQGGAAKQRPVPSLCAAGRGLAARRSIRCASCSLSRMSRASSAARWRATRPCCASLRGGEPARLVQQTMLAVERGGQGDCVFPASSEPEAETRPAQPAASGTRGRPSDSRQRPLARPLPQLALRALMALLGKMRSPCCKGSRGTHQ